MAGRTLNRRALREQADQAERDGAAPAADPSEAAPAKKKARAKAPAAPKPRKPKPKKAPPRLFAHWGVFDGGMKQVALCLKLIEDSMKRVTRRPLSRADLRRVKDNLKGTTLLAADNVESRMFSIARNDARRS